jgi:hypothetical protein
MKLQALILGAAGAAILAPGALGATARAVNHAYQTEHLGVSAHHMRTTVNGRTGVQPLAPATSPQPPPPLTPSLNEVTVGTPIWSQLTAVSSTSQTASSGSSIDDSSAGDC